MSPQNPVSICYHIEISGWDLAENFFVEKTELDWSEEHGKKVFVRHSVHDGAVVFVRLIHPKVSGQSLPVAYQVEEVAPPDASGMRALSLVQLRPRTKIDLDQEHLAASTLVGRNE